jgi:hypothetical protein
VKLSAAQSVLKNKEEAQSSSSLRLIQNAPGADAYGSPNRYAYGSPNRYAYGSPNRYAYGSPNRYAYGLPGLDAASLTRP